MWCLFSRYFCAVWLVDWLIGFLIDAEKNLQRLLLRVPSKIFYMNGEEEEEEEDEDDSTKQLNDKYFQFMNNKIGRYSSAGSGRKNRGTVGRGSRTSRTSRIGRNSRVSISSNIGSNSSHWHRGTESLPAISTVYCDSESKDVSKDVSKNTTSEIINPLRGSVSHSAASDSVGSPVGTPVGSPVGSRAANKKKSPRKTVGRKKEFRQEVSMVEIEMSDMSETKATEQVTMKQEKNVNKMKKKRKGIYKPKVTLKDLANGLPNHWNVSRAPNGFAYYFNENTFETQWSRPDDAALPTGWTSGVSDEGRAYFHNENEKRSTWTTPENWLVEEEGKGEGKATDVGDASVEL